MSATNTDLNVATYGRSANTIAHSIDCGGNTAGNALMKSQNSVRAGARLSAVPGSAGILAGETTDQHSWPARMPALPGGAAAGTAALRPPAPIRRCRLALMLVISLI